MWRETHCNGDIPQLRVASPSSKEEAKSSDATPAAICKPATLSDD
jgi:hypothetical protein